MKKKRNKREVNASNELKCEDENFASLDVIADFSEEPVRFM